MDHIIWSSISEYSIDLNLCDSKTKFLVKFQQPITDFSILYVRKLQKDWYRERKRISSNTVSILYIVYGSGFLIIIPTFIFNWVEDWSILDSLYFIIVSLTTIGFGDFIPRNDPPASAAIKQARSKHEYAILCIWNKFNQEYKYDAPFCRWAFC